ncbi:hypothetical protein GE09DRAFT_1220955 [Coniochaeta sp. 2T2.1]|nr:hypothetical protein GE09DRAFT_1220955 [Coniochaeta sp. 2T2.1]
MLLIAIWTILGLVLSHLGHAIPHYSNTSSNPAQHAALDPCDGINASPVLYHTYGEPECPPNRIFNYRTGFCEGWDRRNEQEDCASFCQTSTIFTRAQEVPFPLSECHWPMECTLTHDDTASWNWGIGFQGKLKLAFVVGISGGYGQTYGMSDGHSWKFTPAPHECGYFSFIPVKKTTCGPFTEADESWWSGPTFKESADDLSPVINQTATQ